jgi:hypothetical protein
LLRKEYPVYAPRLDIHFAYYFTIAVIMTALTNLRSSIGPGERFSKLSDTVTKAQARWRSESVALLADFAGYVEELLELLEKRNPDPLAMIEHATSAAGSWVVWKRLGQTNGDDDAQARLSTTVGRLIWAKTSTYWDHPVR